VQRKSKKYLITLLISIVGLIPMGFFINATKVDSTFSAKNKSLSNKDLILEQLWNGESGARERLNFNLSVNKNNPWSTNIIYNAQLHSGPFLQYAFDSGNTQWIIELAQIYEKAYDYLTETNIYTFSHPQTDYHTWVTEEYTSSKSGLPRSIRRALYHPHVSKKLSRRFKFWLNAKGQENIISSSQFIYALTLIMHYAAKHQLLNHPEFSRFIKKFYPVAMQDHYMRWIFNEGIPVGTFQQRGWNCNGGSFSHEQRVEHLRYKRFGTDYFINHGSWVNSKGYCNAYEDSDGWIAFGLAHLMAANKLNPTQFPIPTSDVKRLDNYLKKSLDLFASRIQYSTITVNGEEKKISIFDLGGFHDHPDLIYSGYTGTTFPGWSDPKTKIPHIPNPPTPPLVGWDISHAYRFVHFYWSMDNAITPLGIKFSTTVMREAYANALLYKVFNRPHGDERDFQPNLVKMNNFMSGHNGWYRVNYSNKPGFGYSPFSKSRMGIVGGQAYFIKYNSDLLPAFIGLKEKHDTLSNPWSGDSLGKLSSYASLPEEVFE
jgi:hypothetical protein